MSEYGIQTTGYVRKPISVILNELEAKMITEFGPGVIQTSQSPLGQLNGMMADLIAEIDERNLDLYQSYDPDQAEGTRLDTLARVRLINRGVRGDEEMRRALTNIGQGRVDIQDTTQALISVPGVTYAQVFVNDSGETENPELERGFVAVAVIGGADDEIAEVVRRYVVPGVSTYGNTHVTTNVNGFCRSVSIIRPREIKVDVDVVVRLQRDRFNCPAPSLAAIAVTMEQNWQATRRNGRDITAFTLRQLVESVFSNVEVISFTGMRNDQIEPSRDVPIEISFIEIALLNINVVSAE